MLTLADHFALVDDEYQASLKALLSIRQAWLVATLIDHLPDRVFAAYRDTAPEKVFNAEDLPAYRTILRQNSPALATIFDLCALRPEGPTLKVVAVEVPIAEYHKLSVEDFMVSLYNQNSVQRVVVAWRDGRQALAHEVLGEALSADVLTAAV
jgi:hypothetical protein